MKKLALLAELESYFVHKLEVAECIATAARHRLSELDLLGL